MLSRPRAGGGCGELGLLFGLWRPIESQAVDITKSVCILRETVDRR